MKDQGEGAAFHERDDTAIFTSPPRSAIGEPVLNPECIGRKYPEQRWEVTAEATRAYALATNDENPRYLDDHSMEGMVAPPIFAIVAAAPSEMLPLFDEQLTGNTSNFFQKMVRGDNDILFSDVIRPGDVLTSTAVVAGIDVKSNGELLRVDVMLRKNGREVARVGCGYFVRGENVVPKKDASKPAYNTEIPRGPVVAAIDMAVTADQSLRYAEASGDKNPIHTDDAVAKVFGHPGIILQGSCSMAFVSKAVIDTFAAGDPKRLKRLRVRYARPVMPGDQLTTIAWRIDGSTVTHGYGLETKKQDGTIVIKNAFAEISR
jgi:acyl dehydratase